jgi:hypothetical protein
MGIIALGEALITDIRRFFPFLYNSYYILVVRSMDHCRCRSSLLSISTLYNITDKARTNEHASVGNNVCFYFEC